MSVKSSMTTVTRPARVVRWIALAGALVALAGCVVVPAYPSRYAYHYRPHPYYYY